MSDVLSWIRLTGPFLIGHRGFPMAARENTVPSFEAALEAGCDGIELDVRMTQDGELVVHHDEAAVNESGSVSIESSTWPTLKASRFNGADGGYGIPHLDTVLRALSGRGLLNIEVKPAGKRAKDVVEKVCAAVDKVRPRESVLISSFDLDILAGVLRREKGLLLGYLFSSAEALSHLEDSEVVDTLVALHPRHDLVNEAFIKRARERGLDVHAWTVDDAAEARRLVALGVTSVITNRPDICGPVLYEGLPP
ncbi:MAG TPA: glycerophosphodiester phosphodiesterase [Dongiaceae bacterium]|jgi:glycerophosphoryl diester phosphodiesterase|nr:glycerophosphodiester phosphodiesterase [Dongiaceae bacterium]